MTSRRDFLQKVLVGGMASWVAERALLANELAFKSLWHAPADDAWAVMMPSILKRIQPPRFPNKTFPITKFGAKGDGTTDCTRAFRDAIAACNKAGGGKVVVADGVFLTGAIHLKSNVNLEVKAGATIKFSKNPKDFLPVVFTRWEGTELMNYSPFIYALDQTNIAITGAGTLD